MTDYPLGVHCPHYGAFPGALCKNTGTGSTAPLGYFHDTRLRAATAFYPQAQAVPKIFRLNRMTDTSGISGTGIVAYGVLWPDGTAVLRWTGDMPSTV